MLSRYVSLSILVVLMLILGVTFFRVMAPFILPLFLAAVVALVAYPIYNYFLNRTNHRTGVAAGLATTAIMAAVVVPIFVAITIGGLQLFAVAENWLTDRSVQTFLEQVKKGEIYHTVSAWGERFFPIFTPEELTTLTEDELLQRREALLAERAENLRVSVQNSLRQLATTTFSTGAAFTTVDLAAKLGWMLMALFTFVMALYYFFSEGPKLIESSIDMIPVDSNHQRVLFKEFGKATRAVVSATFLAALAQGLATSVALWFLGFGHFFLFSIVCTLSALIPLAGTWLVWMPCAGYLIYQGEWGWAIALAIYGLAFIGSLDNIIRAYVLHSDAELHPLLAFVSVLGGLQVMGLWGVFIAPVVACCLHAMIRIFNEELRDLAQAQKGKIPAEIPLNSNSPLLKEEPQPGGG